MATVAQNLDTAIANVAALLAEITADPKPSYSVDGESYSWSEYLATLTDKLEALQKLKTTLAGPYAKVTRGRVG